MYTDFLDPYRPGSSPVHNLDPRIKFILAIGFILTTTLMPAGSWPIFILLLSVIIAVEILSGIGILYTLKRSMLSLPFILAAVPLLFTVKGEILFSIPTGLFTLTVYAPGFIRFLSIALKSWISIQTAVVLAATTEFPQLLLAMRAVKLPRLLVAIFGMMWRYLFVLVDEALRMMRARTARSGQLDDPDYKAGGSIAWRGRVTGGMAGSLFIRSFERSDRIYTAMLSRGYDGEIRSFPLPGISPKNWAVLGFGCGFLVLLIFLSFLFQF